MGRISVGLAAIVAMIGVPVAAAPPPTYNWTGPYVGGNVGYNWGDAGTDTAGSATTVYRPGGCPICFTNPPATFADTLTQRLGALSGGGQIGYNYQPTPNWVLGFETDIQGAVGQGANTTVDTISGTFCTAVLAVPPSAVPLLHRLQAPRRPLTKPKSNGLERSAVALVY